MNFWSNQRVLIFMVLCLAFACKGDDNPVDQRLENSAGYCDLVIDNFELEDRNIIQPSYKDYSNLSFVNQSNEYLNFQISEEQTIIFEGIFTEGDSLRYCYSNEYTTRTLTSENGLEFNILIEPKPYFADLKANLAADVLKISYNDTKNTDVDRRTVFRKVLSIKDYPTALYESTETIASMYFVNNEFKDLEKTNFNSPVITLYYNDEIGIVGFLDEYNVLWEFDSKS